MKRSLFIAGLASLLLLTGAGCGQVADRTTAPAEKPAADQPTPVPAPIPAAEKPAGRQSVRIQGFSFDPAALVIKAGTTVTWTNDDAAPHQLVTDPNQAGSGLTVTDSPTLGQGQSFSHTFDQAGTWKYVCRIHPSMSGSVTVTP